MQIKIIDEGGGNAVTKYVRKIHTCVIVFCLLPLPPFLCLSIQDAAPVMRHTLVGPYGWCCVFLVSDLNPRHSRVT